MMMTTYFSQYIPVFKALSDETRLKIVQMLTCEQLCANEILDYFNMTQPSLSYHMKILTGSGLVRAQRRGGFTVYSVDKQTLSNTIALLEEFSRGTALLP
ncbi:metalloregulator ArsR/SmtB family transcription factor [Christensenellaceae bacterium OttesenSCG-928-L17]|nr:metalloregulator ArsR/SmtB family transcription factor [Christensenellaceae bacterium OttesenSCG-928-L17]